MPVDEPSLLLFVYGTLKRGERNHRLLAGQEFVGDGLTAPRYRLYDRGPYPCLVEAPTDGEAVRGEIWRIESRLFSVLDELEGAPHLFKRTEIALSHFSDVVWGYLYQRDVRGMTRCGPCWKPAPSACR